MQAHPIRGARPLPPGYLDVPTLEVARRLLGALLVRDLGGGDVRAGIIVETEAYTEDDPASHSHGGPRKRNRAMFGPAGTAYVYFTYGMHHCFNVVTEPEGVGAAVLVRAIIPTHGAEAMMRARGFGTGARRGVADGPAKICRALAIGPELNGAPLLVPGSLRLPLPEGHEPMPHETTPRIGISRAADWPRRFVARPPAAPCLPPSLRRP